jgi:hypothetical protein
MELKEFVSEAICQVMEGVKLAQEKTKDTGAIINPLGYFIREDSRGGQVRHTFHFSERIIEFDVAINAIDSESTKGGVGVFFGAVGIGAQGQSNTGNSVENRIRFSVPVYLPFQVDNQPQVKKKDEPRQKSPLEEMKYL